MALTTDSGGYVKAWDVESCVLAYSLPVSWKPHTVRWFVQYTGDQRTQTDAELLFALLGNQVLNVRSLKEVGKSVAYFTIDDCGDLLCVEFVNKELLVIASSTGSLILASIVNKKTVEIKNAHNSRIRGISVVHCAPENCEDNSCFLFSASSDGFLKYWSLDVEKTNLSFISLVNVKCRITDLVAVGTS